MDLQIMTWWIWVILSFFGYIVIGMMSGFVSAFIDARIDAREKPKAQALGKEYSMHSGSDVLFIMVLWPVAAPVGLLYLTGLGLTVYADKMSSIAQNRQFKKISK
jgi:hypothetical protein